MDLYQIKRRKYEDECLEVFCRLLEKEETEMAKLILYENFKNFLLSWVVGMCKWQKYTIDESIQTFLRFEKFERAYKTLKPETTVFYEMTSFEELNDFIRLFLRFEKVKMVCKKMKNVNICQIELFFQFENFKKKIWRDLNDQQLFDTFLSFKKFKTLCQKGTTKKEIFELVRLFEEIFKISMCCSKSIYNKYIGWALPSQKVCEIVYETYISCAKNDTKLIDLGAGSAIFASMFHQMGIPKDKIIAFDLKEPTHSNSKKRNFWKISTKKEYQIKPNDILFIGWGVYNIKEIIDKYCEDGGFCVILLGEDDGCTFSTNYFGDIENYKDSSYPKRNNWNVKTHHVIGAATTYGESLTVNTKKSH